MGWNGGEGGQNNTSDTTGYLGLWRVMVVELEITGPLVMLLHSNILIECVTLSIGKQRVVIV